MQDIYREIGRRIREVRRALRMTQAEVAERVGIDPSFYGQIERGKNVPSLKTVFAVAAVLNVEAASLMPPTRAGTGGDPHLRAALDRILAKLPSRKRGFILAWSTTSLRASRTDDLGRPGFDLSADTTARDLTTAGDCGRVLRVLPEKIGGRQNGDVLKRLQVQKVLVS